MLVQLDTSQLARLSSKRWHSYKTKSILVTRDTSQPSIVLVLEDSVEAGHLGHVPRVDRRESCMILAIGLYALLNFFVALRLEDHVFVDEPGIVNGQTKCCNHPGDFTAGHCASFCLLFLHDWLHHLARCIAALLKRSVSRLIRRVKRQQACLCTLAGLVAQTFRPCGSQSHHSDYHCALTYKSMTKTIRKELHSALQH